MNCKELGKVMREYLDGELGNTEKLRAEEHLHSCASCSRKVEGLKGLFHLVASQPATAPPFFAERVLAGLKRGRRRPFILRPVPALATVLATVLVLVGVSWFLRMPGFDVWHLRDDGKQALVFQPVYPEENSIVLGDKIDICASVVSSPKKLNKGKVKLFLDGKDVTSLASIQEEFLVYTPENGMGEGEHTVLVRFSNGTTKDVLRWSFYTI